MFGPPGVAYVYLVYGMHDCLNVVTEPEGRPAAVLVRAIEVEEGSEAMRAAHLARELARRRSALEPAARARLTARLASEPVERIASGPGRVASAFGLDRSDTGRDFLDPRSAIRLEVLEGDSRPEIVIGPRIGVGYAGEPWASVPWRFGLRHSAAVSRPRPAQPDPNPA